jgi:hypothetical protein
MVITRREIDVRWIELDDLPHWPCHRAAVYDVDAVLMVSGVFDKLKW